METQKTALPGFPTSTFAFKEPLKRLAPLPKHTEEDERTWLREGLHAGYEFVEAFGHFPAAPGLAAVGALGSGIAHIAPTFANLKDGIRTKDKELTLKGIGNLGIAVASFADALHLSGEAAEGISGRLSHYRPHPPGTEIRPGKEGGFLSRFPRGVESISPLLIAAASIGQTTHGIIDIGFGAREIAKGLKTKNPEKLVEGILEIGMGVGASMIGLSIYPAAGAITQLLSYLLKTTHLALQQSGT